MPSFPLTIQKAIVVLPIALAWLGVAFYWRAKGRVKGPRGKWVLRAEDPSGFKLFLIPHFVASIAIILFCVYLILSFNAA